MRERQLTMRSWTVIINTKAADLGSDIIGYWSTLSGSQFPYLPKNVFSTVPINRHWNVSKAGGQEVEVIADVDTKVDSGGMIVIATVFYTTSKLYSVTNDQGFSARGNILQYPNLKYIFHFWRKEEMWDI